MTDVGDAARSGALAARRVRWSMLGALALIAAVLLIQGWQVRVADGHRPDRLVTVAAGTLSTITARNRILPMRRRGIPAPERHDC